MARTSVATVHGGVTGPREADWHKAFHAAAIRLGVEACAGVTPDVVRDTEAVQ